MYRIFQAAETTKKAINKEESLACITTNLVLQGSVSHTIDVSEKNAHDWT
jgi:hypothetical protein